MVKLLSNDAWAELRRIVHDAACVMQEPAGSQQARTVILESPQLSLRALHAVLVFLYTERLDADMADIEVSAVCLHTA